MWGVGLQIRVSSDPVEQDLHSLLVNTMTDGNTIDFFTVDSFIKCIIMHNNYYYIAAQKSPSLPLAPFLTNPAAQAHHLSRNARHFNHRGYLTRSFITASAFPCCGPGRCLTWNSNPANHFSQRPCWPICVGAIARQRGPFLTQTGGPANIVYTTS